VTGYTPGVGTYIPISLIRKIDGTSFTDTQIVY
jgi:hypothetical protein